MLSCQQELASPIDITSEDPRALSSVARSRIGCFSSKYAKVAGLGNDCDGWKGTSGSYLVVEEGAQVPLVRDEVRHQPFEFPVYVDNNAVRACASNIACPCDIRCQRTFQAEVSTVS